MRETAGQEQQPGGSASVKAFPSTMRGQQLDPSGLILLADTPELQVQVDSSQQGEDTPCCLQSSTPAAPAMCSPGAAMEGGFVPVTLGVRAEFDCTARVPHPGCRTGVLF